MPGSRPPATHGTCNTEPMVAILRPAVPVPVAVPARLVELLAVFEGSDKLKLVAVHFGTRQRLRIVDSAVSEARVALLQPLGTA